MNSKKYTFFIILFCLMATVSFAQKEVLKQPNQSKSKTKLLVINEKDNGKTFVLKKGQNFKVFFAKCSAGYMWKLTQYDSTVIKKLSEDFINPSCKNCEGGSFDLLFKFKALENGETSLQCQNYHQNEQFRINIQVKQ